MTSIRSNELSSGIGLAFIELNRHPSKPVLAKEVEKNTRVFNGGVLQD